MNTLSDDTVNNLKRSTLNVGFGLVLNFSLEGMYNSFSVLTLTQAIYIFTAGPMIISAFLPFYSWFVGLFSIPIFLFDASVGFLLMATLVLALLAIPLMI